MSFVGDLVGGVTKSLGLSADPGAGQQSFDRARIDAQDVVNELRSVGIPEVEAQQIALVLPELIQSTEEERLGETSLADISEDPMVRKTIMDAIGELQERGETGLTTEDRARYEALRSQAMRDQAAREATLRQEFQRRGIEASGLEYANRLLSQQAAAQNQMQEGRQIAADAAGARRAALAQAANAATQYGQQQYQQDLNLAQARDQIQRYNAALASQDTGRREQQAANVANIMNQQEIFNKGLLQQRFQNEMARARGSAQGIQNMSNTAMQQGGAQAQAAQNAAAANRQLLLGAAKIAAKIATKGLFKDGGIKDNESSKKMGYEEGGLQTEGRVVPEMETLSKKDNFTGDNIPDRINAGEMVLNLDQQQMLNDLMQELAQLRSDDAVAKNVADVNENQQRQLMEVLKGERDPEALSKNEVVQPSGEVTSGLVKLLMDKR